MVRFRAKMTSGERIQIPDAVRESEDIRDWDYVDADVEKWRG